MGNLWSSQVDDNDGWRSDAQHAMEAGAFCVICGSPFDIEGDVYNVDHKAARYQWLRDFRLLAHCDDLHIHRITSGNSEPVNISGTDDVFLSGKAEFDMAGRGSFRVWNESRTDDIWYNPLWYSHNASGTLFPLHEACIDISCRVIQHLRFQKNHSVSEPTICTLYYFLNTRFLARHATVHDYADIFNDMFDLRHRSKLFGPQSVLALARVEWWGGHYDKFYADPLVVPGIDSFVFDVLVASAQDRTVHTEQLVATREPHSIEGLPVEILDAICRFLPSQSVIKLHRTSKIMATKIQLDNAFWRNSLRTGCLHAHIWDIDTRRIETLRQESNVTFSTEGCDWRSVAKLLATKKVPISGRDPRLDDIPLGLWNRSRIWATVERALDFEYLEREKRDIMDSCMHARHGPT